MFKSFSSTIKLLQIIAKEQNISEEENKKITEIQDWDEVKIMKSNKIKKKQ